MNTIRLILIASLLFCCSPLFADNELRAKQLEQLETLQQLVLSDPLAAQQQLQQLHNQIDKNDRELLLTIQLRLAESANFSYRFEEFEEILNQGMALIDEDTPIYFKGMYFIYSGIIKQRAGRYDEALSLFEQAVDISKSKRDDTIYVYALAERAFTLSLMEEYKTALRENQKAYLLASEMNMEFLLGFIEEVYGGIYVYMENYEESLLHFQKALTIYQKLDYPFYISEANLGIATAYRYWGKWEESIQWLERYYQSSSSINSEYSRFYFHYGLSMVYAKKNDCAKALTAMNKVLSVDSFDDYKAEIYKQQALCHAKLGDFKSAKSSIQNAQLIFSKIPELQGTSWELEVKKIQAEVAALQSDYQAAYELLIDYLREFLSVHKNISSKQLEKLKLSMQMEREKLEIKMMENQAKLNQLELKQQIKKNELQQVWLYGAILLLLIIVLIVFWQLHISKRFKAMSMTDELTGLRNRRFMFNTITKLLATKSSKPVFHSLMLIDIDDLKPINDNYGHQDGDKVIKMVAEAGSTVLRYGDVFARVGGDEYMLLITRGASEQEVSIANRILNRVNESPVVTRSGEVINVSVSIGIVSITGHDETAESIYSQVDKALYRAKNRGRNCISH